MKYLFHAISAMMVLGFFFIVSPDAYSQTAVYGEITENTTWTSANSPYIITGNIRVKKDVTLTIEKNVKVQFRKCPLSTIGYYLQVDGTLVAQGEMNSPIIFTSEDKSSFWGCIAFTDTSVDWDSLTKKGSVIKYAIIEYAGNSQGNANRYGGAAINCFYARPLISDNIIRYSAGNGISVSNDTNSAIVSSGIQTISNNWIYNNSTGIFLTVDGCLIENNYFLSNARAISFGVNLKKIEIVSNTLIDTLANAAGSLINGSFYFLVDNTLATPAPPTLVSIRKNVFKNGVVSPVNGSGQVLMAFTEYAFTGTNQDSSYVLNLTENTIENGENATWVYLYNWQHSGSGVAPLNMTGNFWGTAVESEIKAGLYDNKNDFYLPVIDYDPYQNVAVPGSGSSLLYPPVANAGRDQKVPGGVPVTLDGSGSYDPDDRMRYQWTQTEGMNVGEIKEAVTNNATFASPYSYTDNTLVFTLTVTDKDTGFYDTDEVTVVVTKSIANAGKDKIAQGNTEVTLDASETYGLESNKTYQYQWIQLSGPDVELTGEDKQKASFMAPYVDIENELVFQLTVTDENGFSGTDEITITINKDIANAGLDREVEGDDTVVLDGSGTYDRPDERLMTYEWTQISGPEVTLTFYDDNMRASFIAPYIDEEQSVLVFQLTVSNANGFESIDEVMITIKEPKTIVRKKGDCFIGCLYGPFDLVASSGEIVMPVFLIFSMILFFGIWGKVIRTVVRKYGKPHYFLPLILILIVFVTPDFGHAGYFSVGNGGGGEAGKYNLSIETGAVRLGGETSVYLLGGGVFGMFHGYDDFPANTRDYPCPHSEYVNIDKIIEGIESGLFGKAGIGLFDTDIYVSALAGISMVTEVQLVQSNQTKLYYEQSSEQKFFGIYGGGIGYFPDRFRWEFCVQLDYDNRRGVIGSIGFHW